MAALDARIREKALAATRVLARLGAVRAAYVFGSHVDGRSDPWSDIDVAAFMDEIETWDIQRRAQAMAYVMEEAGTEVEAHLFPASALTQPSPGSFADYILQHGVCILGQ